MYKSKKIITKVYHKSQGATRYLKEPHFGQITLEKVLGHYQLFEAQVARQVGKEVKNQLNFQLLPVKFTYPKEVLYTEH